MVSVDPPRRYDRQADQGQEYPLEHLGLGLAEGGGLILDDQAGHAARNQQMADVAIEPNAIGVGQARDAARQDVSPNLATFRRRALSQAPEIAWPNAAVATITGSATNPPCRFASTAV